MEFKAYEETEKKNQAPNLDAGTILHKVTRVETNKFQLNGQETEGMRIWSVENGTEKEFRTSSGVLIKQFKEFFEKNPKDTLDNVKVVSPRGKQYLKLEAI